MAQQNNTDDTLLNDVQAAEIACLSVRTLRAWRVRGFGPAYVKAGRAVRYRRSDLLAWIKARTVSPGEQA
ncbi:helix-turn-helix transcriptional regulator [Methylobacterium nodulans]|uniref:Helix-turn-helix domain-containing protein n=1 Tax=Methylobacterium nodulans (strain LMG 21967 / CNCM I-2342 / ORS 2060) TaxID=460265 RepID=B8IY37_METNO|nr:helix-turn-helix domain-containing protein [Methylobacterium nodulans]ACL63327.1 conserved hypothetical protein [Methylobacterium nodulans ORS 2060]